MRRTLAAAAAAALAASGLTAATPVAAAPTITWGACSDPGLAAARAECGFLRVPLNHAKPNGAKIEIAVSRMKATVPAAKRQGVMLVNPGGPGGSGLGMAMLRDAVPRNAGKSYDWIGFDPRGVGSSKPALTCISDYASGPRPPYVPASRGSALTSVEKQWLSRSKAYAAACGKKHGALLPHMHTINTVKDMDLIRAALGAKRINYYGFSYGSYLGQIYSTTYPNRVRRMVWDGIVEPRGLWYDAQLRQDHAFEKVIGQFFAWVASHHKVYRLGTTAAAVRAKYDAELAKLRAKPALGIGPSEWTDVFTNAGYAEFLWPSTASAFATRVVSGDMREMSFRHQQSGDLNDDNGFAVYNAVQCVDAPWPRDYAKGWRADSFDTAAKAPFMTWANVWFNTACIYWPAASGKPVKIDGRKAGSLLMINSTGDGATPYSGALHVRSIFPKARLIAERGSTTHSGSLGGNACIDNKIAAYLATGALPARKAGKGPDVSCASLPLPDPSPVFFASDDDAGSPAPARPVEPAPTPTPPTERSVLESIIGLLPKRA